MTDKKYNSGINLHFLAMASSVIVRPKFQSFQKMKYFQFLFLFGFLHQNVCAYKFLAILPTASKSHYYIGHNLMKGLAEEGHEVTVISPFQEKTPIENYNEVYLENSYELAQKYMTKHKFIGHNSILLTWKYLDLANELANWTLSSQNLHNFINTKQHFDAIIVEMCLTDALIGFGQHFNAPVITLSAFGASKWTNDLVGTPIFASYVPHTFNPFTDRMNFWQRMFNSLTFWFEDIVMHYYYLPEQQKIMVNLFPEAKNWPSLDEMRKNVSLALLNTHTTLGTPRPYAPNMIEVGGMQIKKEVDPLPLKIKKFLDEAKNGAILLSLGSNVLLNMLPKPKLDAITGAFRLYPGHRILIKGHERVAIPSHNDTDVLIEPWFDQQSILAHKNIKLFITHGGILSLTEAVYTSVPLVGIPFFFDQFLNMQLAEQKGFGINVPIQSLTAENIASAVQNVLGDPSYAKQAKITSDRFRDQPLTPLETAKHWVRHVAKNQGAPHLKSVAVELPFYKLYNLDVWAFIIAVFTLIIFGFLKAVRSVVSYLFTSEQQKIKKA